MTKAQVTLISKKYLVVNVIMITQGVRYSGKLKIQSNHLLPLVKCLSL